MFAFIKDERGWADFFITRIGLILFAAVLLLSAFRVYPMFQEKETKASLDITASGIASDIEAAGSIILPEYRYVHLFDDSEKNVKIQISTEYVIARSFKMRNEGEFIHAEPLMINVYPPNSNWSDPVGLRRYLDEQMGRSGDFSSPLDLLMKEKVDNMFGHIKKELARSPFEPDLTRPLVIEKATIYYNNSQNQTWRKDYVLIYQ